MVKRITYEEAQKQRNEARQKKENENKTERIPYTPEEEKDFHTYHKVERWENTSPLSQPAVSSQRNLMPLNTAASSVKSDTSKNEQKISGNLPMYTLKDKSGNTVGEISRNGLEAIGSFNASTYKPYAPSEAKTFEAFESLKGQPMFNISIDGKPYEVSYNAGEAVTKGNFDYNSTNKADEEAMKAFRSAPLYEYTIGDKTFKLSHNAKKSIENRDFSYTPLNSDEQSVVDAVRAEQFTVYNDYMLSTNPTDPAKREALVNKKSALDAEYDSVYVTPQAATRSGDPKLKERYNRMKELGDERKNITGQIEQYDISVDEYNWRKSAIDEYNALDDDKRRLVTQYINAYTAEKEYDTNLAHLVHPDAKDIMIEKAPKENIAKAKREEYEKQLDGVISKGLKQYIQQYVNFMDTEEQREFLKESNKNPLVATANTVLSVPASLVSPIGLVETVSAKVQNRPIDPNSGWYGASNYSENVRSDIKNKISEGNGVLGQIGAGAYDLGTNLADFFAATAVGGGIGKAIGGAAGLSAAATSRVTSVATQALMASRSASDTIKQAKRDGASDSQAMVLGLVSGMAEAFFEKYSIENWKFFKTNPVAKKNVWTFLKSTAKGFLPEGTEELATDLANFTFDNVIMGENSTYNRRVKEIMASENVSEDKARAKASLEVLGQSGYAFLLGGLSGSFMSGIGHIVAPTIKERANYLNKYANSIKLVDNTFNFNPLDPEKATAEDIERVEKLFEPYEKKVQQYNKEVEKARRNEADSKIYELSDIYNAYRGEVASELEAYKNSGKTDEEVKAFEAAQKDRANDYKTLIGKYRRYKDGTALADEFIANASASLDTATHIDITDNSPALIMSDGRGKYTVIDSDGYIFTKNEQQIAQRYTPVEGTDANAIAETAEAAETTQAPDTAPTATESVNISENASINTTDTEDGIHAATSEEDRDIAIENAKRESGFGNEGVKLLADLNKNGTVPRTEVKATKAAYIAGYTNDSDFKAKTDAQKQAFEAGKKDRTTRDAADIEKAKNATVYGGSVVANERYKKLSKQERKMAERIAKDAGLSVEFVGVLFADAKKTVEANAQHTDGKLERSDTSENEVHVDLVHEVLHRMKQIAPKETGVLIDALYRNAENISGKATARGALYDLKYDEIKAQHDAAGLTSMEIGDYIEEVATREIQRFFSDAATFNKWRDKLDADAEIKSVWQRFGEFMRKLIDDLKRAFSQIGMSAEERASANKALAELEEIEKLYANAYKATQKAVESAAKKESTSEQVPENSQNDGENRSSEEYNVTTSNSPKKKGTDYSLKKINGKSIVWIDESNLTNTQLNNHKAVAEYIRQHIGEVYTIIESGQSVYIGDDLPQEYTQSKYTTYLRSENRTAARGKNKAVDGLGELIETATNRRWEKTKHTNNKDAKYGMYRYDSSFAFPVKNNKGDIINIRAFDVELLIRNASDGKKYLYDIVGIKENTTTEIGLLKRMTSLPANRQATRDNVSDNSISQKDKNVNTQNSLKDSNGKTEAEALENVGIQYDGKTESVAPSFSLKTWNASKYVQDREEAVKAIMKATGATRADAERYINNINGIAKMIADDRERLDYESNMDEFASVIKANSEYKWTVDMSTLCAKRLLMTGTFDAIQKALPNTVFDSEDIVALRSMMLERGYEVACGICYVESTRRELGPITQDFIERYKLSQETGKPITRINSEGKVVELKKTQEQMKTTKDKSTDRFFADKDYTPTLAELNTTDIDLVKRDHPLVYEAYLNYMNARGQAKPKLLETRAEYKGEILKIFADKRSVKSRNDAGGLRVQSFSDFEVAHLIDMMQIVLDMSQVGLMSQAYTKVPAFAEVFGNTGIKINLSLIAKGSGLDENGNLIFDDVEGMPHEEAFRLRDKYSKNVGTILVGKNDDHIKAALADDRIDFVIPFHKSSWKESLYDALGLTGYDDYTDYQNEKPINGREKIKNFQPSEYWDYSKSGYENAQIYLEKCKEDGRNPKFPQFVEEPGYWKLLIDFKMYDNDGVGSPQTVVTPDFAMDEAFDILNEYEGGHRSLPVAQDVVDDFVEQYSEKKTSTPSEPAEKRFSLKTNSGKPSKETQKLLDTINKLKNELKLTEFAKADPKELTKMVKGLIKDYYSTLEVNDIYDAVDKLYQYMANGEEGHPAVWENVYDMAYEIAHEIVMSSEVTDDSTYNDYASLISYLRTSPMKFDAERDDLPQGYASYFKKNNLGRLKFTKKGASIDSFYQELSELYPEFFNLEEQTSTLSKLSRIEEVLDKIQPIEVNPFSYEVESASAHLANDIINRFLDMPQAKPTFADKQKRKLVQTKIAAKKKLDNLRERKDIQIKKEKQKREAAIAKMSEEQKAKVLRARILRHADKLKNKLLKPTDKQHIPQILQRTVAKMLESINLESSYEYVYGTDGKYHRVDRGEYRGAEPSNRTTAFIKLKDAYAKIAKGPTKENPDIEAVSVDPDLMGEFGLLDTVIKMGDKRISDMSSEELDIIWQTIKAVEASISSVNKMFSDSRYATVEALANAIREDNDYKKGRTEFVKPFRNIQRFVQLEMLNPETFFHWMGNSGDTIFRMMRNAQDEQTTIMKEVSDFTKKTVKDTKIAKLEKNIHTVTLGGKEVKLSTAQLMELYVLMNREQAKRHILGGGISPEEVGGKPVDGKKTFKERVFVTPRKTIMSITPEEIEAAINNLSEEQKAIADKLQKYASTVLSDYGNKASMQVYNYEKFNEDVYWPIRVDRLNLKDKEGSGFDVPSVAAKGFTRATDPNATSSIYIGSIFDTFAAHAAEMATYSAWLGTMEDVNRVRNFSFRNEDGKPVGNVKAIINNVHGEGGAGYLQKLMTDIAIGSNIKDLQSPFDSFTGAYKAAAVGANLRVIIQQPTSILRATEMINPVYILKGMARPLSGWEKAKKYAPIAQWKNWGHFDLNTGRRMKDVLFDSASNLEKAKQFGMKGTSTADNLAWGTLWNAVEEEIKSKHPEYGEDNEEFYNAVASRFTEIIDHTQVVDGVLQRNGVMRQKDGLFKMASSFMSEPTKQYNMALYAAYDALISKDGKRMKAVGALGKTAIALVISVITNAAAQSVIDALRDDDREKDYLEKWRSHFGENSLDAANPLNYIPFAKDIVSIAQGYDVNRMDTETIAKTFKATTDLWKAINGKGKISKIEAITNLIGEAGRIFGLPASNLKRDIKSIATTIVNSTDNYYLQYIMDKSMLNLGFQGNSQTFMPILYEAYKNDKEAHELIYNDLIKSGFYDAKRIKGNMEDRMKDEADVKSVKDLPKRYEAP